MDSEYASVRTSPVHIDAQLITTLQRHLADLIQTFSVYIRIILIDITEWGLTLDVTV